MKNLLQKLRAGNVHENHKVGNIKRKHFVHAVVDWSQSSILRLKIAKTIKDVIEH